MNILSSVGHAPSLLSCYSRTLSYPATVNQPLGLPSLKMKYSAILSSLSLCASSALAAPPTSQQEMHRRILASQNGNAQDAQWNAIVKQAGPDLIILCQEILPRVIQVVVGRS